uniref:WAT1-related protein n=1 Tax=Elaeis guineensis var. tenera TaxID=51953 RepID=A0A6I9RCB7_ELAGV|nr:WAT1-related protein At5g64700 [Elaeis guineensis]
MNDAKVYLVAVLISFIRVGMQILTKAAFNTGMSITVFVFYRQVIASLFLAPIAFVLERKRAPPLPFRVCFQIFMLACLGLTVYFNIGTFLMTIAASALSLWMVLQGPVLKAYPSKLLFTTLQCLFSTVQSFFVALAFERDFSRWKLGLDINLISVAYGSIIGIGVSYYLQSWTIEKRGPVFLAMFMPLTLAITMILSSFLLGEQVTLGSVLGGSLMVGGLYSVLWGKSKEHVDI